MVCVVNYSLVDYRYLGEGSSRPVVIGVVRNRCERVWILVRDLCIVIDWEPPTFFQGVVVTNLRLYLLVKLCFIFELKRFDVENRFFVRLKQSEYFCAFLSFLVIKNT